MIRWGLQLLMLAAPGLLCAPCSQAGLSTENNRAEILHAAVVSGDTQSGKAPAPVRDALMKPHASRADIIRPGVRSSSVLVVDETDASILYAKKADLVVPVASITKLMTALVALEASLPLDERVEITTADRDTVHGSGSRLMVGATLSRSDLLHLALMSSENRAAHALGRSYPGGLPKFVRAMNARAQALGMKSTRFVDPTGLSGKNVSSAADLIKLVIAASNDPLIRRFSTNKNHTVQVGRRLLEFHNTNTLVSKPDWDIALQKTGYTSDAGQCLVMKATIHNRPVIMVFLNSFGKLTRVAEARRIRKWMEASEARVDTTTLSVQSR